MKNEETKLIIFEGKNVRIQDESKATYIGYVLDYIYPEDNEPEGVESLILKNLVRETDGYSYPNLVEFTSDEITKIEETK